MHTDYDYSYMPLVGNSAGLCLIWNTMLIANLSILNLWICLSFNWNNVCVRVILVYAPMGAIGRRNLWSELQQLLFFKGTTLPIRDFNEFLCLAERLNWEAFSNSVLHFSSFINLCKHMDLPLQGLEYTWRNSVSASRIDRGWVNA